jgi:hypothetical protein
VNEKTTQVLQAEKPGSVAAEIPAAEDGAGRPYWLTGPCPPWCTIAHRAADHPEDRYHDSERRRVVLSTEAVEPVLVNGERINTDEASELVAELTQSYREAEPRLLLLHNDTNEVYMTLGEAEEMALGILSLVAAARDGQPEGANPVPPAHELAAQREQIKRLGGSLVLASAKADACQDEIGALNAKLGTLFALMEAVSARAGLGFAGETEAAEGRQPAGV